MLSKMKISIISLVGLIIVGAVIGVIVVVVNKQSSSSEKAHPVVLSDKIESEAPPSSMVSKDLDSVSQEWLDKHNKYRKLVGYPELVWDHDLADLSTKYAETMTDAGEKAGFPDNVDGSTPGLYKVYNHDIGNRTSIVCKGSGNKCVQNLEMNTGPLALATETAGPSSTDNWYTECTKYKETGGVPSKSSGHYTGMMWKGASKLGCGKSGRFTSCLYDDGNIIERNPLRFVPGQLPLPDGICPGMIS